MTVSEWSSQTVSQVSVAGQRLSVRRGGPARAEGAERAPVLLLHGIPQTSGCWSRLMSELGDRRTIAPDLPGLGESEPGVPADALSVAATMAQLVVHEVDRPLDVVGHDFGALVACTLAATRPDLVRRLVVMSGPYRWIDPLRAWHVPLLAFTPPVLLGGAGPVLVRTMFRFAWRAPQPLPAAELAAYVAAYSPPQRMRGLLAYYRAAARADRSAAAPPPVAERSLLVWGAQDPSMPPRVGEKVVRQLERSCDPASIRMVTLPGVGHWPLDEAPGEVVPLIADFLRAP